MMVVAAAQMMREEVGMVAPRETASKQTTAGGGKQANSSRRKWNDVKKGCDGENVKKQDVIRQAKIVGALAVVRLSSFLPKTLGCSQRNDIDHHHRRYIDHLLSF
jgi:hypothetical protein